MATVKTLLGNVKGPKGDTGPQGETGPQGPRAYKDLLVQMVWTALTVRPAHRADWAAGSARPEG